MTSTMESKLDFIRDYKDSTGPQIQGVIARYISDAIVPYFPTSRTAMLLDSYDVASNISDVWPYKVKDWHKGYAVVNSGTGVIRMQYPTENTWNIAEPRTRRTLGEWIKRKDIANHGQVLVECRPQGLLVKNDHPALKQACLDITLITRGLLAFKFR